MSNVVRIFRSSFVFEVFGVFFTFFGLLPFLSNDVVFIFFIFSPIISILCLKIIEMFSFSKDIRVIALSLMLLTFLFGLELFRRFDMNSGAFQFEQFFSITTTFIDSYYYHIGLDIFSLSLVLLTSFLIPLSFFISWRVDEVYEFIYILFFLEFFLFQAFSVLDLLMFYIFFEAVLIPMYFLIGIRGSRIRRVRAAIQFFLYTLAGSVLILYGIMLIHRDFHSSNWNDLVFIEFDYETQLFLWWLFFVGFAVKIPLFPLHIWLPEAHGEASTAGSVLLAGILLKLGVYGYIRFMIPFFGKACFYYSSFVYCLVGLGILYSVLSTLRQNDIKKIIAYSSVAHMGVATLGVFSNSATGIAGATYTMISHGLISSALFICAGILYDRYGTRLLHAYHGLTMTMPYASFIFLILSLANMGLPPSSGFISEFIVIPVIFQANTLLGIWCGISMILTGSYTIWFFTRIFFGPFEGEIQNIRHVDFNQREMIVLFTLISAIVFFGIFANYFVNVCVLSSIYVLASMP